MNVSPLPSLHGLLQQTPWPAGTRHPIGPYRSPPSVCLRSHWPHCPSLHAPPSLICPSWRHSPYGFPTWSHSNFNKSTQTNDHVRFDSAAFSAIIFIFNNFLIIIFFNFNRLFCFISVICIIMFTFKAHPDQLPKQQTT